MTDSELIESLAKSLEELKRFVELYMDHDVDCSSLDSYYEWKNEQEKQAE